MINRYKNLNLHWKLSLLITTIAIFTAITISFAVYFLWTDQIRQQVSEQLQKNTELAAYAIQKDFIYEQNNLNAWSQLDVMIDIVTDDLDKRIINTLILLKKNYQLPGNLILVNNDKQVIASTDNSIMQIEHMEDSVKLAGDLTREGEIILSIPIYLSIMPESIAGYLILTHPWQNLIKQLGKPLQEFLIEHSGNTYHFSHNALRHIADINEKKLLETYWNMQSQEKIHSRRVNLLELSRENVYVYGTVNKNEAFKSISSTLWLIAFITLVLLLPITFISIWSSNRFLKPMIELQEVAEKIADSGNLNVEIPIKSNDEIGLLAGILNKMTSNLKISFEKNEQSNKELQLLTETLESRVKDRTHELSETLQKLKNAQSQLVQSEKMSSLGLLVAGIAHELNNPISSVYVNTRMLNEYATDLVNVIDFANKNSSTDDSQLENMLQDIDYDYIKGDLFDLLNAQEDAAKRIRDIVLSLRTFSRLDEAEIKAVDLNQSIDNTISILRHEIKDRISLEKNYQLQKNVECFPGEINQVFLNILANAAQAIEGKGNICISTSLTSDNMAEICIADDGPGLPQSVMDKVFDPFFTTKAVGVGTGLGLSISYGIIEKHKGKVSVENISPHGAKFIIKVPIKQTEKI